MAYDSSIDTFRPLVSRHDRGYSFTRGRSPRKSEKPEDRLRGKTTCDDEFCQICMNTYYREIVYVFNIIINRVFIRIIKIRRVRVLTYRKDTEIKFIVLVNYYLKRRKRKMKYCILPHYFVLYNFELFFLYSIYLHLCRMNFN